MDPNYKDTEVSTTKVIVFLGFKYLHEDFYQLQITKTWMKLKPITKSWFFVTKKVNVFLVYDDINGQFPIPS
jgi:hypothetical protein